MGRHMYAIGQKRHGVENKAGNDFDQHEQGGNQGCQFGARFRPLMAMAQNKAVCDAYTQNFNHPDRQWDTVATPERTAAFIARHTAGQPAVAA